MPVDISTLTLGLSALASRRARGSSSSVNNDDTLRAPKTDTAIASGMPLSCGSFPSVVASILWKHFSVSSQTWMTLCVGLWSLLRSFISKKHEAGVWFSEPRTLQLYCFCDIPSNIRNSSFLVFGLYSCSDWTGLLSVRSYFLISAAFVIVTMLLILQESPRTLRMSIGSLFSQLPFPPSIWLLKRRRL